MGAVSAERTKTVEFSFPLFGLLFDGGVAFAGGVFQAGAVVNLYAAAIVSDESGLLQNAGLRTLRWRETRRAESMCARNSWVKG